jgi:5-carboxymethyl-2-hydroxymuconic-semialdehyde dehydrogenase
VIRKPAGVAGLITPWNTPLMLETWKLAPALAAGCPVVLKPAEWTPLSASLLPEIMTEAGLPDGVFNLVHGIGEVAGAALVTHPGVPRISFTGETGTGRAIMAAAAPHLKGLSMELGGKSPCVIFADADLDQAIDSALFGVFSLNGERCTAGSRILAERSIYDALVTRLASRADRILVGDPADPRTEIGALVHPEHYARVLSYVQAGRDEGARLVAGGQRPSGLAEHLTSGNYLAATVFADVEPSMRIFRKQTVHDVAFTGGEGPRQHHLGFFAHESHQVLRICDILARCTKNPKSSEAPAGTGCPTPSTCTCGTRTGTGWRSTPATTSPATPAIPCCAGRCATRGAGISGATR